MLMFEIKTIKAKIDKSKSYQTVSKTSYKAKQQKRQKEEEVTDVENQKNFSNSSLPKSHALI